MLLLYEGNDENTRTSSSPRSGDFRADSSFNDLKDSVEETQEEDLYLLLLTMMTAGRMRATGRSASESRVLMTLAEPGCITTFSIAVDFDPVTLTKNELFQVRA